MVGRISMPRLLRVGAGASLHLPEALKDLGCRKPLLVTDSFLSKSGVLKPVQAALSEASMVHHTFDGAVPDPTTASLDEGIAAALMHESDVRVGKLATIVGRRTLLLVTRSLLLPVLPRIVGTRALRVPACSGSRW